MVGSKGCKVAPRGALRSKCNQLGQAISDLLFYTLWIDGNEGITNFDGVADHTHLPLDEHIGIYRIRKLPYLPQ
jgi:hypothetical protein